MQSCTVLSQCRWIIALKSNLCAAQQKCRVPKGSLGISLSEYRLAIRAEGSTAEWIHIRARRAGCTLLWGDRRRGERWDRPWGVIVSTMHHVLMLEIKNQMMQKGKQQWKLGMTDSTPVRDSVQFGVLRFSQELLIKQWRNKCPAWTWGIS